MATIGSAVGRVFNLQCQAALFIARSHFIEAVRRNAQTVGYFRQRNNRVPLSDGRLLSLNLGVNRGVPICPLAQTIGQDRLPG